MAEEQNKLDQVDNAEEPIAVELAKKQREVSISQFFERNRHLLGFDNKRKALLTTIKEAVDNSLDACEEADILPEVSVEVIEMSENRFKVIVEDNGPGIVKKQIPHIFARLLYGSKFFKLSQSRGQQGIGISASVMYAQLTTGKAARIISKIDPKHPAHFYELKIDTQKNKPEIVKEEVIEWEKEHGTKVELDLEGSYQKGDQSIDQYLKQTAIVNPHITLIYQPPKGEQLIFARATDSMPKKPVEIKPHPYGVEIGRLMNMLKWTESRTLQSFLMNEFSRVGSGTAKQICENAALLPKTKPHSVSREMAESLLKGINGTKIISPPTDCISPLGAELLEKGLRKEVNAEFYAASTRPPNVYRGNPFVVEVACAYGGEQPAEQSITLYRFANRVPLLYQQGACSVTKSVLTTNWRSYGLSQSSGALPAGPLTLVVHLASVWVPYTSESKEAIAHYPEIIKEIKLALQECGRKLGLYIHKKKRIQDESKKRDYIEIYIPHISDALKDIIDLKVSQKDRVEKLLKNILEKKRGKLEEIRIDNPEYDKEFAKIGKKEKVKEKKEEGEKKKEA
ncbi:DNA topoisomerase VI subunit B [Candidatus Woesearchaeota archaeon]|nr:DNA topoisomerase VI subunit B [Candidatus Woesearchaeota archaeon]|tara:strand:- start:4154 stop:5857 length:1704 start_codon:yes stop_codon:yes gene_type:complete